MLRMSLQVLMQKDAWRDSYRESTGLVYGTAWYTRVYAMATLIPAALYSLQSKLVFVFVPLQHANDALLTKEYAAIAADCEASGN